MDPEAWASCVCPLCGTYRTKKERILNVGAILSAKLEKRRSTCDATIRKIRAKRDAQSEQLAVEIAELRDHYDLEARAIDAAMHAEVARLMDTSVTVKLVLTRGEHCTEGRTALQGPEGPAGPPGPWVRETITGPWALTGPQGRSAALTD